MDQFNFGQNKGSEVKTNEKSDVTEETKVDSKDDKGQEVSTTETKDPKIVKLSDFSKVLPGAKNIVKDLGIESKENKEDEVETEDKGETKPQRDLTGFGEREAKWLQRMPFEAYEYFSKQLKDTKASQEVVKQKDVEIAKLKEGKTTLPDSYYENPQAGWLQPEVQELQGNLTLASQIETHWKQQLINVETGKDWFDLIEGKNGEIFVDNKPKSAGIPGEAEWAINKQNISQYFQQAINQTGRIRGELNGIVTGFQSKHKELLGKVKSAEDTFMPMFKDEASDEYKKVVPIRDELVKFGLAKDNPAINMLAKSVALNMILKELYLAEKSKREVKGQIADSQRRAGPNASVTNGASPGDTKPSGPSLKDFGKLGLRKIEL
jgi:hypothetical protein